MSSKSKGKMFVWRYLNDLFLCLRRVDGVGSGKKCERYDAFLKAKYQVRALEKVLVKA